MVTYTILSSSSPHLSSLIAREREGFWSEKGALGKVSVSRKSKTWRKIACEIMKPVALEEILRSVEIWLGLMKKPKPPVNPKLDPVLIVPGIAGSVLHAVGEDGKEERVWVRILGADRQFRTKMWSRFDPATGKLNFVLGICDNLNFLGKIFW